MNAQRTQNRKDDRLINNQRRVQRPFGAAVMLGLLAVIVFANSLKNDFVGYDDPNLIVNNEQIRSLSPENLARIFSPATKGNYQPIRTLSYALDYAIWGLRPFGYHLTNICLHAAGVVCVWLVLRHVLPDPSVFIAAAIFAVHPIHVENVTWLSARKDVLSLVFFLLAIVWYERAESNRKALPYLASLMAAALALLSKITAVTLPFCIILLELCRDGWPDLAGWKRKAGRLLPHVALVVVVVVLNFAEGHRPGATVAHGDALASVAKASSAEVRDVWLSMPMVCWRYLGLLAVPYHQSTHYEVARISEMTDPRFLLPVLFLVTLAVAGVVCFVRGPRWIAFSIGWGAITFLPTSNIVPAAELMSDRYMHAPSIGFAALLAGVVTHSAYAINDKKQNLRKPALIPVITIILLFSIMTIRGNTDWRDTATLFRRTLAVNPASIEARLAIGATYIEAGDFEAAIKIYREALTLAPGHYRILYNLGVAFIRKGWFHQAAQTLEQSRSAHPDFLATRLNLALVYHRLKRYDEAISEHREVLRLDPRRATSYGDLGRIYLERGELGLALEHLNRALDIQPDLTPALIDRVLVSAQMGRYGDAERDLAHLDTLGVDTAGLRARMHKQAPERNRTNQTSE
ncbi:MAG: tetratricopeptide repeat protein [Candidatus Abyssubacteria bacterium]